MTGPVRVGFVDHAEQLGGAQKSLLELLPQIDRDHFEPVLFCTEAADWLGRPELAGVELVQVFQSSAVFDRRRDDLSKSVWRSAEQIRASIQPVVSLRKALVRSGISLVHTNTLKAHMIGTMAARLARIPLVWHVRDILEPGPALHWLARAARFGRPRIIAISRAVSKQFAPYGLRTTLIHNGIPLDRFSPGEASAELRDEIGVAPADRLVFIVGRLTPWKGHQTLLKAMARVIGEHPDAVLVVVGEVAFWEADYREKLRRLAGDLGIEQRVRWLGFRDDIPELLRLCEVFALPSENEPFGRAIIEAMAGEKPVVATNGGGVPEIVVDGETGFLTATGDADALAEAIGRVLADRGLASRMGAAGGARVRDLFDTRRVAQMVQDLYDEVLGG